jgi:hypothetical protein
MSNNHSSSSTRTLEFQRLEFPMGWGETGAVFLRVRVYPDGTLSFFCSKAPNSGKTNVTSSFEKIFDAAVRTLAEQGVIPNPADEAGSITPEMLATIAKNSVWVEYTSAADSVYGQNESFAIVRTDPVLNPCWSYVNKATAAKLPGLDRQFLTLPTTTAEVTSCPDAGALAQLDEVYFSIRNAASLLKEGDSFGIQIGLTAKAKSLIVSRHGQDAFAVLENCVTLD